MVFYLDLLDEYQTDYARIESSGGQINLLAPLERLSDLGFCIERVPALAKLERIDYILAQFKLFPPVAPDRLLRQRSSWRIPWA